MKKTANNMNEDEGENAHILRPAAVEHRGEVQRFIPTLFERPAMSTYARRNNNNIVIHLINDQVSK